MTHDLPSWETYGNYKSKNCGVHALRFELGSLSIWFSYHTPVAFALNGTRYVRQNDWSTTTGRHLNAIDGGDKRSRLSGDEFETKLREALLTAGVAVCGGS